MKSAPPWPAAGTLLLVNREHPLLRAPESEELTAVDRRHPDILLHRRAKVMLDELLQAAGAKGSVIPVSGYRSQREQRQIWDDTVRERGLRFTRTYVAAPGCSEHQTGLAVDLGENVPDLDFICPCFPDSGPCRALREKAADYGFVLRYPMGKEAITGIGWEPWHFRYVGWPHARIMTERNLVLEEYLAWLRTFPAEGAPLRYRAAGRSFEVCYAPDGHLDTLEALLSSGMPCQCSDTNTGGMVFTLWRDAG